MDTSELIMMSNDIEWKMIKLGDVAEFLPTNTLSRDELNYSEGEYLNIHYGDVLIKFDSVTDVLNSEIPFISINKKFSDRTLLKNGDIVMADTAEDESVGKVTEIQNIGNYKVVSGLHTLCIRFQENLFVPKFAGYYLNSPAFHNLLLPYMHGTKVTSISKKDVKKIIFPIPYRNCEPDLETQELIAQKLGDMDSLIAAKEKLLAKKRDLKIGAMQKLIKQEESENWQKVKIGDYLRVKTGSKNTEDKEDNGKYPLYVRSPIVERINEYTHDCEAVLTAGDGVGTGKVFHYVNGKFAAHQRVYVISNFKEIDGRYFYYQFSKNFYDEVMKYTAKSSVDSVRRGMITGMEIALPFSSNGTPDLIEQKRIASILSDMDSEIASLENEISKLQNLKTAMMQKMFCFNEVVE